MYLNFMPSCLQPPVASSCSLLYVAFSSRGVPAIYGGTGGFASCQQARQARPAESSSLALRAGVSPPVALHAASRPRSSLRLTNARRAFGEDSPPTDGIPSQAH